MQGIKEQKERESSRVYVQVSHASSRVEITPNQVVDNTELKLRTKKKRPKQYYNTLEDAWFKEFPSLKAEWPSEIPKRKGKQQKKKVYLYLFVVIVDS